MTRPDIDTAALIAEVERLLALAAWRGGCELIIRLFALDISKVG